MRRWLMPMALSAMVISIFNTGCTQGGDVVSDANGGFDREAGCQPTLPPASGFEAPDGRMAGPSPDPDAAGLVAWYGSSELWTVLDVDGAYTERKSVWWSTGFPGGDIEERPEISVVATRLDQDAAPIRSADPGTNGFTDAQGWFMIADFPSILPSGCWEITGSYKGASLTLVSDIP